MRLQKRMAYKKDNRTQYKYEINIPEEAINELGWREGNELKESVVGKSLIIDFVSESGRKPKKSEPKMSYQEFRDKIKEILEYKDGMTWTEIRAKLGLEQVVPNNKWVRQMQNDIGLIRLKDSRKILWRLRHV